MFDGQSSFSTFRINELTDRINIRAEYGDLEIEKTVADFGNVVIQSKSTDISLYFPQEASFNFEISQAKTEMSLTDRMKTESETISEDGKTTTIKGYFGESTGNSLKLNISAESGIINVRSR